MAMGTDVIDHKASRDGDSGASSALEELIQAGYRYARALQADPMDGQDLVHEAWIRVSGRYGERANKALLFRAVRNLHVDRHRHASRFRHVPFDDEDSQLQSGLGARDVVEVADAQLERALASLREDERETLFLAVVEGYTAAEIADLVGSPRGSILSLIHRARAKLRSHISAEELADSAAGGEPEARGQPAGGLQAAGKRKHHHD